MLVELSDCSHVSGTEIVSVLVGPCEIVPVLVGL